ncbi:MAG: autotransporter-associated beta strand repeat-containing protein [Gemmatales bacterium]
MRSPSRMLKHLGAALAILNLSVASSLAVAGDNTWTNSSTDFTWNTTSLNWSGAGNVWNNAAGDGAIFGAAGIGTINVPGAINVNSLNLQQNGYTFNGAGSLNFVNGTSTQTTGVINVASGTTQINVPLTSAQTAIQKIGAGTLELTSPINLTSFYPVNTNINGTINANIIIGPTPTGVSPVGGTIKIANASVLPASTSVAIGAASYLDIGSNNITLSQLMFQNQYVSSTWPSNGVIGTGTLKVTGEVNVFGQFGDNYSNTIATNFDLDGKNQIFRVQAASSVAGAASLVMSGVISNGSVTKTLGYTAGGVYGSGLGEGIAFMGNNTYTGATIHNVGSFGSIATGTNASGSLKVVNGSFTLQGANGSFGSASTIKLYSGGSLVLDNNVAFGAVGNVGVPFVPAANNNDRIADTAAIEMRDSNFTYRGLANIPSSETFGSLNATGGHNVVTLTPNGVTLGGSVTLTNAGNLSIDSRSTMQVNATGTGTVLGTNLANARFLVNGTVPASVGGIIPRMIGPSDFLFYDATNGFTPLASGSYNATLAAGGNVNLSAATATAGNATVNALKMNGSFATTINSGDTLAITTGMMLATGTHTINGPGTLAFGNTPGVIFGSTTFSSSSVVTGTQGILHATGTLTLGGNLSALSGTISNIGTGTLAVNTNTFTGAIENRRGTLNIGANTFSSSSGITLGVAANDVDLLPANPSLSISAAGANAVISVPILVDNGATNAAGLTLNRQSYIASLAPLSNNTGSQTVSSNITLNTSLNFQGGGGGGTGSTLFSGNITGSATLVIPNGRANFSGNYTNAGGMIIGTGGNTAIITLSGTGGSGPWVLNGGSTSTTSLAYTTQANLGSGSITVQNTAGANAFTINALGSNSINNAIILNGDVFASVGSGITAAWAGVVSGKSNLTKNNTGTLVLSNNANTQTGAVTVNAGTLLVNGNIAPSTNAVTVNANATLGGSGTVSRTVTVANNGSLAPGNSPGQLTIDGNLTLSSGALYKLELNGTTIGSQYDSTTIAGAARTVTLTGSVFSGTTTSTTFLPTDELFVMVLNDSASSIVGTFSGVPQDGTVFIPAVGAGQPFTAQVSYTGDFGSGAISGGNDIVLYNFAAVPEPTTIAFMGVLGAGAVGGWYYRRRRLAKLMDAKL